MEKIKYEAPQISVKQVETGCMIAASFKIVKAKENLEPLKENNDVEDSEWESPSASSKKSLSPFYFVWE